MAQKIDEVKGIFDLSSVTGLHRLHAYLVGELHLMNVNYKTSSIKITVKCRTLEILEGLWDHYCSGRLNAITEKCLITEKVKDELGMGTIKLAATMLEEDYFACKLSLMEISGAFYYYQLLQTTSHVGFKYRSFPCVEFVWTFSRDDPNSCEKPSRLRYVQKCR